MEPLTAEQFEEGHRVFDGKMSLCSGAKCPRSCCLPKRCDDGSFRNTVLLPGEYEFLCRKVPDAIQRADLRTIGDGTQFAVSGCLMSAGGWAGLRGKKKCLFEDCKPVACMVAPFAFTDQVPSMDLKCPVWYELSGDAKVVGQILAFRKALGFAYDNWWKGGLMTTRELKGAMDKGIELVRL